MKTLCSYDVISFHETRHTFGSLQVEAGTSIYVVQKMLAHKNVETTQIYADMADEQKQLSVSCITCNPKDKITACKSLYIRQNGYLCKNKKRYGRK